MENKRNIFDVLKEINASDIKNGTGLLSVSNNFVKSQQVIEGGLITMGVDLSTLLNLFNDKISVILICVDNEELKSIKSKEKTGIELIAEERQRQIEVEGYTIDDDKEKYKDFQLSDSAICYAAKPEFREVLNLNYLFWPFEEKYFKPTPEDRIRELTKAGALIAAQIDLIKARNEGQ